MEIILMRTGKIQLRAVDTKNISSKTLKCNTRLKWKDNFMWIITSAPIHITQSNLIRSLHKNIDYYSLKSLKSVDFITVCAVGWWVDLLCNNMTLHCKRKLSWNQLQHWRLQVASMPGTTCCVGLYGCTCVHSESVEGLIPLCVSACTFSNMAASCQSWMRTMWLKQIVFSYSKLWSSRWMGATLYLCLIIDKEH